MRLIDADATRKNILNLKMSQITRIKTLERIMMMEWCRAEMLKIIDNAPTIDAEPVRHGRWIKDDYYRRWSCSECGALVRHNCSDYCNCGAKMDGGANGNA